MSTRTTQSEAGRRVATPGGAANAARLVWGVAFFVSSVANLLMTLPNPDLYREFADLTFLPGCRSLLLQVALPNAHLISGLVVLF
ncbi:MAG: hypothetical protein PVH50_12955 [Anaerolineae bacterium]